MGLQLFRPLITNRITQHFNENKACKILSTGKITSKRGGVCPTGSVEFYPTIGLTAHNGTDYAAWRGEPVFHAGHFEGRMKIEKDFSGGIGVDVISTEPVEFDEYKDGKKYHYKGYVKCRYWHLKAPVGYDGKIVRLGETIGLADNTGASSGDHLHFNVKKCDEHGQSLNKDNGYYGAFDHTPFMDDSIDAKTKAEYLYRQAPPVSAQERKEMLHALSTAQRLLNLLLELKRKL